MSGLSLRGCTDVKVRGFDVDAAGTHKAAVELRPGGQASDDVRLVELHITASDKQGVVVGAGNTAVVLRDVTIEGAPAQRRHRAGGGLGACRALRPLGLGAQRPAGAGRRSACPGAGD